MKEKSRILSENLKKGHSKKTETRETPEQDTIVNVKDAILGPIDNE